MTSAASKPGIGTPGFCIECIYWAGLADTGKGECRRYPPTAGLGAERIVPITRSRDWCGDFAGRGAALPLPASATSAPNKPARMETRKRKAA